MKKSSISAKLKKKNFSLSKPKVVCLRPFLSSLSFSDFLKQILMFFGRKHVETEQSFFT